MRYYVVADVLIASCPISRKQNCVAAVRATVAYEREVRETRTREALVAAQREDKFLMEKVHQSKRLLKKAERQQKKVRLVVRSVSKCLWTYGRAGHAS